jgi:acid phosphatase
MLLMIVSSISVCLHFYIASQLLFPQANLSQLISQGIFLENYFSTTHPSEPNYVAVAGGDNFGMDNDNLTEIPANVSTVVDLLESKGITWAEYQEGMPSTGFTGFDFNDPDGANKYVRKHK